MRHISIVLILSFFCNSAAFAQTTPASGVPPTQESAQTAKFRQEVQKRGAGEKSRVKIKLSDGTELKGYISKIDESSFEVTDKKITQTKTISYSQVQKIQGPGLSKAEKLGIGVGATVAVVAIIAVIAWEQFNHSKGPSFPI